MVPNFLKRRIYNIFVAELTNPVGMIVKQLLGRKVHTLQFALTEIALGTYHIHKV